MPTSDRPFGTGGTTAASGVVPAAGVIVALAIDAISASHFVCSGLTSLGAVGPNGLPKIQLIPTRIRLMPMMAMIDPVTTGGK